ncbi:MAG TPA: hypothetical protein VH951_14455 [Dehalococcoidia bacterium]
MPAITSQNLILGLALVLTIIGLAGLAPSLLNLFRRKRLLSQLARLKVEEDTAQAMFPTPIASPSPRPRAVDADDQTTNAAEDEARPVTVAKVAYVAAPVPAERTSPSATPVTQTTPGAEAAFDDSVAEAADEVEDAPDQEELEAVEDLEVSGEAEDRSDETVGAEADEDDLLAMFKDTKIQASAPAVLTENMEIVSAADLLAQARELRDLLRKAA